MNLNLLSKVEIDILKYLWVEKLIDQMNSRTIRNIAKGINLNYYRVRSNLNHLLLLKMVKQGFKEKSSNTFYITKEGINEIKEI